MLAPLEIYRVKYPALFCITSLFLFLLGATVITVGWMFGDSYTYLANLFSIFQYSAPSSPIFFTCA